MQCHIVYNEFLSCLILVIKLLPWPTPRGWAQILFQSDVTLDRRQLKALDPFNFPLFSLSIALGGRWLRPLVDARGPPFYGP